LGDAVVLLHAFAKKIPQVPRGVIDTAVARMEDLNRRLAAGEVLE
jgi:phage-related protein